MKTKSKKTTEPAWQKAAKIDAWKKQQFGWVVYTPGPAAPVGYIRQVNECFSIISDVTDDPTSARMYTFEHAFEILQGLKSRHNRRGHIEYVGPRHPEE